MTYVAFVVPCIVNYPSAQVRVLQYLPFLDQEGIYHQIISYFSPSQETFRSQRRTPNSANATGNFAQLFLRIWYWLKGHLHVFKSWLQILSCAQTADVLFIQWIVLPPWLVRLISHRKARLVFDFDDAVFLLHPESTVYLVKNVWRVIAGSHFNLTYARQHNPNTCLIPSGVPTADYLIRKHDPISAQDIRLGWIGSPSTMKYLSLISMALSRLADRGYKLTVVLAGTQQLTHPLTELAKQGRLHIEEIPTYQASDIPQIVNRFDIGLMPLDDTDWERGKCAMKCLIYMAGSKPTISSAVGEVLHIVQDSVNGYLASSVDEWEYKLIQLIKDVNLRNSFGVLGRDLVIKEYSTDRCWQKLNQAVFSNLAIHPKS